MCCHSQTDCFVVSQLFIVARYMGCLKLGSKPTQLYIRLSILTLSQRVTYINWGIIRHYVVTFVCLHLALRIPRCSCLNIYIYIYIYIFNNSIVQPAGAAKYTDCFSAEG